MKKNKIYYLKKYHKGFYTSKKVNEIAIIDLMCNDIVYGHYLLDPSTKFMCMKHEFSKIFSGKPQNINQ